LVEASDHNLYGTTEFGGPENAGVVFRFNLPPCEDTLTLGYAANTLTMGFTIRSSTAAGFGAWLVSGFGIVPLWTVPIPEVTPAVTFDVPVPNFPHVGNIGVLMVLAAPSSPTACWDWKIVNTGGAGPTPSALTKRMRDSGLLTR
jgi:uncharacterized repeat protein (TIGR03803 family)